MKLALWSGVAVLVTAALACVVSAVGLVQDTMAGFAAVVFPLGLAIYGVTIAAQGRSADDGQAIGLAGTAIANLKMLPQSVSRQTLRLLADAFASEFGVDVEFDGSLRQVIEQVLAELATAESTGKLTFAVAFAWGHQPLEKAFAAMLAFQRRQLVKIHPSRWVAVWGFIMIHAGLVAIMGPAHGWLLFAALCGSVGGLVFMALTAHAAECGVGTDPGDHDPTIFRARWVQMLKD